VHHPNAEQDIPIVDGFIVREEANTDTPIAVATPA
jgi:hypothetical protein